MLALSQAHTGLSVPCFIARVKGMEAEDKKAHISPEVYLAQHKIFFQLEAYCYVLMKGTFLTSVCMFYGYQLDGSLEAASNDFFNTDKARNTV